MNELKQIHDDIQVRLMPTLCALTVSGPDKAKVDVTKGDG